MSQIQYIAAGHNDNRERVILWRTGDYQYQLEVAGKKFNFLAEYYDALECFKSHVIETIQSPLEYLNDQV